MARKLKVFRTHIGFYEMIVAAPSQKAALEAWGAGPHQFKQGFAAVTDDPEMVSAALARPGAVLRRQFGSNGAFEEEGRLSLKSKRPAVANAAKRSLDKPRRRRREAASRAADKAKKDRRQEQERLNALDKKVAELEKERRAVIEKFERRKRALVGKKKRN